VDKSSKIFVAGHEGMVGSAICRELKAQGYTNLVVKQRNDLDLRDAAAVETFFSGEKVEYVIVAAAVVGGILANMNNQAQFLHENMQIQMSVINSAYRNEVTKLLFLGSSCIFPKEAPQPIAESSLLTGPLEPTNEGYAIAKIAGLKLCEYLNRQNGANFISLMPCNLYGYNDNFDLKTSHFLPALIRKFYEAVRDKSETVSVWGSGNVQRELLFVDDLAKACVFALKNYSGADFLNVGYGEDYTIREYAEMIKKVSGFEGKIVFDTTKPDGMKRKLMNSTKFKALGWKPETRLQDGIKRTYEWYSANPV